MPTLADVAARAHVTAATVSNVIRGKGSVGAVTADRVRAAIAELGYRPNLTARALAEGRAPTLALIVPSIDNPFYPEFALIAERAVRRRGHFLLVCSTDAEPNVGRAYMDRVAGGLSEGILAMAGDLRIADLETVAGRGVPVVLALWEGFNEPGTLHAISLDFAAAGHDAALHLLELGHRQIGMIVGTPHPVRHALRRRGFEATMAEAACPLPPEQIILQPDSIQGGYDGAMALLTRCPRLTAIFATNDLAAIGALQAASELGLKVPQQLSIIGTTDIQLAAQVRPALTTVSLHTPQIAEATVAFLLELIEQAPMAPQRRTLPPPELIRRGSTAPPPGRA